MSVILTEPEAGIATEAIAGYIELRQLIQRHASAISAILGTSELSPMSPTALQALEHLLGILRGTDREDTMIARDRELAIIAGALEVPTREQLGGDDRVLSIVARAGDTATSSWVAGELEVPEPYAELWLHDLQADELVRELLDGRGNLTWELTEKGHNAR